VQKLEQNKQGWWRVLAVQTRKVGWLPANILTENLEESQAGEPAALPSLPNFYVAVNRLALRRQPQNDAEVVKVLQFNDQVEKLDQTPGWLRIRQSASGAEGWVPARFLEAAPAQQPRETEKPKKIRRQHPIAEPEPEIM
jgi:hypothetical protein